MSLELAAVFGAALVGGLAGSAHCVGMCGPFATYHGLGQARFGAGHISYHLGRLTTYLALATAAGMLGTGLSRLAGMLAMQRALAVMMGAALVLVGLAYALPPGRLGPLTRAWARVAGKLVSLVGGAGRMAGPYLLGLSSTLLPCGFLYAFALAALATGSTTGALATMAGFWLGTVPALVATSAAARWLRISPMRNMRRAVGVLLILLGILGTVARWPAASAEDHACCHDAIGQVAPATPGYQASGQSPAAKAKTVDHEVRSSAPAS